MTWELSAWAGYLNYLRSFLDLFMARTQCVCVCVFVCMTALQTVTNSRKAHTKLHIAVHNDTTHRSTMGKYDTKHCTITQLWCKARKCIIANCNILPCTIEYNIETFSSALCKKFNVHYSVVHDYISSPLHYAPQCITVQCKEVHHCSVHYNAVQNFEVNQSAPSHYQVTENIYIMHRAVLAFGYFGASALHLKREALAIKEIHRTSNSKISLLKNIVKHLRAIYHYLKILSKI